MNSHQLHVTHHPKGWKRKPKTFFFFPKRLDCALEKSCVFHTPWWRTNVYASSKEEFIADCGKFCTWQVMCVSSFTKVSSHTLGFSLHSLLVGCVIKSGGLLLGVYFNSYSCKRRGYVFLFLQLLQPRYTQCNRGVNCSLFTFNVIILFCFCFFFFAYSFRLHKQEK